MWGKKNKPKTNKKLTQTQNLQQQTRKTPGNWERIRVKGNREKAHCLLVLQAGITYNGPRSPTKPGQLHPFSHVYAGRVDHQGEGEGRTTSSTLSSHPSPAVPGKDKERGSWAFSKSRDWRHHALAWLTTKPHPLVSAHSPNSHCFRDMFSQTASLHRLLRAETRTSPPVEENRWAGDRTLVCVGSSPHAAVRAKFNKDVQQDPTV